MLVLLNKKINPYATEPMLKSTFIHFNVLIQISFKITFFEYTHACTHARSPARTHARTHVRTYVYMYVCVYCTTMTILQASIAIRFLYLRTMQQLYWHLNHWSDDRHVSLLHFINFSPRSEIETRSLR